MRREFLNWIVIGAILFVFGLAIPTRPGLGSDLEGDFPAAGLAQLESIEEPVSRLATPQLIERARLSGLIDEDTANLFLAYALSNAAGLPAEFRSEEPWDGTLSILHLQQTVQVMKAGAARTIVETVLAGVCGSSSSALPLIQNSTYFHIQYAQILGGLTINDYANLLDQTWASEVTTFGWWAPPVKLSNPPPGNRYHVRIDALGAGLYGYVTTSGTHAGFVGDNPNTAWNEGDAYASCMVLNNDYSPFPGSSSQALSATAAHEFNHSIQFGVGALSGAKIPDDNFVEGGATWIEDEVFDSSNDNYNYLWPSFGMCMGQYTSSPYPYWITFRGLTERYGAGSAGGSEQVMQDFWELASKEIAANQDALKQALANRGASLADSFHAYAVAVKFAKACTGGYAYPYCLEEGPAYILARGLPAVNGTITTAVGGFSGNLQDNYAINWVRLPKTTGPYSVTLSNTSTGGQLRGSVVCDTGSTLRVQPLPAVVGGGASTVLDVLDPAGCLDVVAVLTNQNQTTDNPTSCTARGYKIQLAAAVLRTRTPTPTSTLTQTPAATSTRTPTPTATFDWSIPLDKSIFLTMLFYSP